MWQIGNQIFEGVWVEQPLEAARIRQLLDALRRYRPERVYLFGSWARGEEDDLSDLDVVVIKRTSSPFFDRLREVLELLPPGTGGIDVLVYTPEEFEAMQREGNAFAEMIVEEGKLIYAGQAED
jgi:predicted nucleotidyltransferase